MVSPNFIEKFVSGDDPVSMLNHVVQCFKFLSSKLYRLAAPGHFHAHAINFDVFESVEDFRAGTGCSPDQRAYTGYEYFLAKANRVDAKLKALASLKAAALVGCPF